MKKLNKKNILLYTGFIALGIVGGLLYWKFIGCRTGTCAMKSNPYYMAFVGGLFGYLVPDMFLNRKKVKANNSV